MVVADVRRTVLNDPRIKRAVRAAHEWTSQVRSCDLLAGAIASRDTSVMRALTETTADGFDAQLLLDRIRSAAIECPSPADAPSLATDLLAAIDAIPSTALSGLALERVLSASLRQLPPEQHALLSTLDVEELSHVLARFDRAPNEDEVRKTPSHPQGGASDAWRRPSASSSDETPWQDLSGRWRDSITCEPSPFAGDAYYESLLDSICRVLHRPSRRHVVLVGDKGIGKSLIVSELARRAALGDISFLAERRFLWVDCRYTPFEVSRAHLNSLFGAVDHDPLLVGCVAGLGALLRGPQGAVHRATFLAALSRAQCRFVGLMTPQDYEDLLADSGEVAEVLEQIPVLEPNRDMALRLVKAVSLGLAQRYNLSIADDAIREAVNLTADYVMNDRLPTKAIRILQAACENLDYERRVLGRLRDQLDLGDVVAAVARRASLSEDTLRGVATKVDFEHRLSEFVVGQPRAVREVAKELALIKAGLTDEGKPASVMMFIGQTGTGKTELAKALAKIYSSSKRLRTYTLGNFVEPHSVSGIIGVPAGYVGHDQGGRLINELNADPYGVFLLDEADKAHPDVLQPLLNLFDEGWILDQRGSKANADRAIFVLTTNVGQRMIADLIKSGTDADVIASRVKEMLVQIRHSKSNRPVFSAEFLARIKRIVVFQGLSLDAMKGIVHLALDDVKSKWLGRKQKQLRIPEDLVDALAKEAFERNERSQGKEGGRIVHKLIADWLEAPLLQAIYANGEAYMECTSLDVSFVLEQADDAPKVVVSFALSAEGEPGKTPNTQSR